MSASLAEQVAELDHEDRVELISGYLSEHRLTLDDLVEDWRFWARPEQLAPPGAWTVWLIQTGRRWGKGRSACEFLLDRVDDGRAQTGAIANRTITDVRAVQIEGPSGLIQRADARGLDAEYVTTHRTVYVRRQGTSRVLATFELLSAQEPDGPRGRGYDTAWVDELGAWPPKVGAFGETCWTNLLLAMSAGDPRIVVSTTPKPTQVLIELNKRPHTAITRGSLYDNRSNLAETYVAQIVDAYAGTRLAAQEIDGVLILVVEGALWRQEQLNADRWETEPGPRRYTVVGVDPPAEGGECGIVVAAVYPMRLSDRVRNEVGILADYSIRSPGSTGWTAAVVKATQDWSAHAVVVETNQGGQMVRSVLRAAGLVGLPITEVRAKDNKRVRAEPIATLSERHLIHHVGDLPLLEGQLTGWDPDQSDWSPDRLDAMVHAVESLRSYLDGTGRRRIPQGRIPGVHERRHR